MATRIPKDASETICKWCSKIFRTGTGVHGDYKHRSVIGKVFNFLGGDTFCSVRCRNAYEKSKGR